MQAALCETVYLATFAQWDKGAKSALEKWRKSLGEAAGAKPKRVVAVRAGRKVVAAMLDSIGVREQKQNG